MNGNVVTFLGGTGPVDSMAASLLFGRQCNNTPISAAVSATPGRSLGRAQNLRRIRLNANGSPNPVKLCYANVNVNCVWCHDQRQNSPVTEAQAISSHVGDDSDARQYRSWKFDYDSYGNVTHLGLPLERPNNFLEYNSAPGCGEHNSKWHGGQSVGQS